MTFWKRQNCDDRKFLLWLGRFKDLTVSKMVWIRSLASFSGLRIISCGVGHRCISDPELDLAPIPPSAQELLYAEGTAVKTKTKTKN